MSILLEALRKSEKSQRPAAPPTIHSEEQSGPASDSVRIGLLALLLVVALAVISWLIWRQYQPSGDVYEAAVTQSENKVVVSTPPVEQPDKSGAGNVDGKASGDSRDGHRTPVESYEQPVKKTSPASPQKIVKKAKNPARTPVNQAKGSEPDVNIKAPSKRATANQNTANQTTANQKKSGKKKAAGNTGQVADRQAEYQPQEPAPISYWELPDGVRADIPEIKFSVLVYANEPADRFVLMNGQRLKEGDSYQQGLVVEEIQRDGVVFSYRLYKFVIER